VNSAATACSKLATVGRVFDAMGVCSLPQVLAGSQGGTVQLKYTLPRQMPLGAKSVGIGLVSGVVDRIAAKPKTLT
jgi:hypothetical protein